MSDQPDIYPYGTWPSIVTPEVVGGAEGAVSWVGQPDGTLWWVESRPAEGGRLVLMREGPDGSAEVTGTAANVRTRFHEYGGLPWAFVPVDPVGGQSAACFTEWSDQRLYLQPLDGGESRPLTPKPDFEAGYRYAEPLTVGSEIWVTREEHLDENPLSVRRAFVAVPLDGSAANDASRVRVLGGGEDAGGHHFLAGLRVSPDGRRAAWLGWNHPLMPWDETELIVADVVNGTFGNARVVAGGHRDDVAPVAEIPHSHTPGAGIAVCQLEWQGDDRILFLSDATGWFNLHRIDLTTGDREQVTNGTDELGGPLWRVGTRWFAPLGGGRHGILNHGSPHVFDENSGELTPVGTGGDLPQWGAYLSACDGRLASMAYGPKSLPRLVAWRDGHVTHHGDHPRLPRLPDGSILDPAWLPQPRLVWFTGADGAAVPTNVYPPTNPSTAGPAGQSPPYVVHIHGGPTGENGTSLDLEASYFTSRGIGFAAPEYGGSTGFGRAWRERLNGGWGVIDLADAETVARGLADAGLADPKRMMIRGGSAGGFTTALALTTPSSFVAGCAQYPVLDLVAFGSGETHDLESHYMVELVGALPEALEKYRERSPSSHAASLHGPLLIQQGLDDRICLPSITRRFVDQLEASGKPYRYTTYEGEQHGFRMAETIHDAIDEEFEFLMQAIGIAPSHGAPWR